MLNKAIRGPGLRRGPGVFVAAYIIVEFVAFRVAEFSVMRVRVLALVPALLAVLPASVHAAMVSPRSGEVRVGTGQGFQRIVAPTEVAVGAQVMVGPTGAASIAYSDNCVVTAPAAAVTVVESRSPCSKSLPAPSYFGFAQSTEQGIRLNGEAFGFTPKVDVPEQTEEATVPAPPKETKKTASPAPSAGTERTNEPDPPVYEEKGPEDHNTFLVVGGVVAGAGALAAILASQGSDGPASP
jgi:hypothetical protein